MRDDYARKVFWGAVIGVMVLVGLGVIAEMLGPWFVGLLVLVVVVAVVAAMWRQIR